MMRAYAQTISTGHEVPLVRTGMNGKKFHDATNAHTSEFRSEVAALPDDLNRIKFSLCGVCFPDMDDVRIVLR
jgi:hypothetical protein